MWREKKKVVINVDEWEETVKNLPNSVGASSIPKVGHVTAPSEGIILMN